MKHGIWWFFSGLTIILSLSLLNSCGEPVERSPVELIPAITPTLIPTISSAPSIDSVIWEAGNHTIKIGIKNWPKPWPAWKIFVNGIEIPTDEEDGDIIIRPNAPLSQPPDALIVGTLPWASSLDNVDFPCCGSLQVSIPNIGLTDKFVYNLQGAGCVTASKIDCASEIAIDEGESQEKPSIDNMVLIPAGTFIMGRQNRKGWTPMAAPEMFDDELPPHEVYLEAFYIDKYEVTNAQFKEFVDATGYITDAEKGGASDVMVPIGEAQVPLQGSDIGWKWMSGASWHAPEGHGSGIADRMDHPVVHVTWNDANAYAKWIGKRLPTEAEWEKAARGGTQTNWFWGDALASSGKYANMYGEHRLDHQYPEGVYDGFEMTAPVGSFQPNEYGLYDMAGNVFEWTADWYQYDYFSASPGENPQGPNSGSGKVIKGGAWYICECYLRPANRQETEIKDRNHGLGFRLVLDADNS